MTDNQRMAHADYFKKALSAGTLPDWHCEHCGRKQSHQVMACESSEEGKADP